MQALLAPLKRAYGAGYRAGLAELPLVRPGGTRGIVTPAQPLNPYRNAFNRRGSRILAHCWDNGLHDGLMRKFNTWLHGRKAKAV